jgi:hypothetical protein
VVLVVSKLGLEGTLILSLVKNTVKGISIFILFREIKKHETPQI